jgi:hypothetical protein
VRLAQPTIVFTKSYHNKTQALAHVHRNDNTVSQQQREKLSFVQDQRVLCCAVLCWQDTALAEAVKKAGQSGKKKKMTQAELVSWSGVFPFVCFMKRVGGGEPWAGARQGVHVTHNTQHCLLLVLAKEKAMRGKG